ncbi:YqaA family protein [Wolbachia pipientis]|nr:hypothetical protein [Wolbachia pipientis]
MTEKYCFLLIDSFISTLVLPVHQGFAFKTMLYFKEYNAILAMLFCRMIGCCLAGIVNWFLGRAIFYARTLYHSDDNHEHKLPCVLTACAVMLLSWIPVLGSVIQVIAGYLKLNIYVFIFTVFLSYFFSSLYLIFII